MRPSRRSFSSRTTTKMLRDRGPHARKRDRGIVRFRDGSLDRRVSRISLLAVGVAFAAGFIAQWLMRLITLITNIAFFHRVTFAAVSPSQNHLGVSVVVVPVIGGAIVGLMARYGSKAIRGHGIPEAMEQ